MQTQQHNYLINVDKLHLGFYLNENQFNSIEQFDERAQHHGYTIKQPSKRIDYSFKHHREIYLDNLYIGLLSYNCLAPKYLCKFTYDKKALYLNRKAVINFSNFLNNYYKNIDVYNIEIALDTTTNILSTYNNLLNNNKLSLKENHGTYYYGQEYDAVKKYIREEKKESKYILHNSNNFLLRNLGKKKTKLRMENKSNQLQIGKKNDFLKHYLNENLSPDEPIYRFEAIRPGNNLNQLGKTVKYVHSIDDQIISTSDFKKLPKEDQQHYVRQEVKRMIDFDIDKLMNDNDYKLTLFYLFAKDCLLNPYDIINIKYQSVKIQVVIRLSKEKPLKGKDKTIEASQDMVIESILKQQGYGDDQISDFLRYKNKNRPTKTGAKEEITTNDLASIFGWST